MRCASRKRSKTVEANKGLGAEVNRLAAEVNRLSALYADALGEINEFRRAIADMDDEDRTFVSDAEMSLNEISEAMDD